MPKFNVTVSFDLTTTVEPSGFSFPEPEGSEDFEDGSYFSEQDIDVSDGSVSFMLTADSEDDAYATVEGEYSDGSEVEDDNNFTWLMQSVNIEIETAEPSLDEALDTLRDFAQGDEDEAIAARIVLESYDSLQGRIETMRSNITGLEDTVRRLSERLAAIEVRHEQ